MPARLVGGRRSDPGLSGRPSCVTCACSSQVLDALSWGKVHTAASVGLPGACPAPAPSASHAQHRPSHPGSPKSPTFSYASRVCVATRQGVSAPVDSLCWPLGAASQRFPRLPSVPVPCVRHREVSLQNGKAGPPVHRPGGGRALYLPTAPERTPCAGDRLSWCQPGLPLSSDVRPCGGRATGPPVSSPFCGH